MGRSEKRVIRRIKNRKATGPTGLGNDLLESLGDRGVDMMYSLFREDAKREKLPKGWKRNELVPIYKNKEDPSTVTTFEESSSGNMR